MTTYTIFETNGGSLHLFAYDNGTLKFAVDDWQPEPILSAFFDLQEGYTAEQLNNKSDWPLDDDELERIQKETESFWNNTATARKIADEKGLYAKRANNAGMQFLHAAQWYTERESTFDTCSTYEDVDKVCENMFNTLQLNRNDILQLFEGAVKTACDIACRFDDSDELEHLAACIQSCGRSLNLLRNCQCDYYRYSGTELQHVSEAEEAEERQLSFEFASHNLEQNEHVESIIRTYWPHDEHTEHSECVYERDGENVWLTWHYTR